MVLFVWDLCVLENLGFPVLKWNGPLVKIDIFSFSPSFPFLLFLFFFLFQDRVSQCIPDCPGVQSVDQPGLEFAVIYLPLPPEC